MSDRDNFIARMKAQLDEWSAELHALEAKLDNAEAGVKESYRHAIRELRERRAAAEAKLHALSHASDGAWEELRDEVERTWTAFKAGMDAVRDFSDHS